MKRSIIETILGAVVLLTAVIFLTFSYNSSGFSNQNSYQVTARFNSVDGLAVGSDIRIGGIKIGSVTDLYVDMDGYEAVVSFSINDNVNLPVDSEIIISSNGLLGGKYIKINPAKKNNGKAEKITAGGVFKNTKDVLSMEEMLGRVIFLVTDEDG